MKYFSLFRGRMIHHHPYNHHFRLSKIRALGLFRFRIYFLKLINLFRQSVGLHGLGIRPTQGLYLHHGQHNTESSIFSCKHIIEIM